MQEANAEAAVLWRYLLRSKRVKTRGAQVDALLIRKLLVEYQAFEEWLQQLQGVVACDWELNAEFGVLGRGALLNLIVGLMTLGLLVLALSVGYEIVTSWLLDMAVDLRNQLLIQPAALVSLQYVVHDVLGLIPLKLVQFTLLSVAQIQAHWK